MSQHIIRLSLPQLVHRNEQFSNALPFTHTHTSCLIRSRIQITVLLSTFNRHDLLKQWNVTRLSHLSNHHFFEKKQSFFLCWYHNETLRKPVFDTCTCSERTSNLHFIASPVDSSISVLQVPQWDWVCCAMKTVIKTKQSAERKRIPKFLSTPLRRTQTCITHAIRCHLAPFCVRSYYSIVVGKKRGRIGYRIMVGER